MSDQPHDPAHTPQGDHTPRQEEEHARNQQAEAQQAKAQGQAQAQNAPPPVDEEAAAADKEARAASSIGAQVILDYNSDGSLGARGGAGASVEENTLVRDVHLVALGLDPVNASGPPIPPDARPEPAPQAAAAKPLSGKATRVSSLAAGIVTGDAPTPELSEPARE